MRHHDVAEQLDYLYWARDRVLEAAAHLAPAEFQADPTVTGRSLRATLLHQVEHEWAWRIRLADGAFPEGGLRIEAYPDVASLAERWAEEERELRAWFGGIGEDALQATPPGPDNPLPRWRCLLYVVNHGVQQLTEAALVLTRAGHSPGEIGYLAFCLHRDRPGA